MASTIQIEAHLLDQSIVSLPIDSWACVCVWDESIRQYTKRAWQRWCHTVCQLSKARQQICIKLTPDNRWVSRCFLPSDGWWSLSLGCVLDQKACRAFFSRLLLSFSIRNAISWCDQSNSVTHLISENYWKTASVSISDKLYWFRAGNNLRCFFYQIYLIRFNSELTT